MAAWGVRKRTWVVGVVVVLSLCAALVSLSSGQRQRAIIHDTTISNEIVGAVRQSVLTSLRSDRQSRIMVYYHLHAINNWRATAVDQIGKLVFSGLFAEADVVHLCLSTPDKAALEVAQEYLTMYGPKLAVVPHPPGGAAAERATLLFIRKTTLPSDRILYIHSKGVSDKNQKYDMAFNVWLWRNMMEFFLIRHWRACVDYLDEYDVVGKQLSRCPAHI